MAIASLESVIDRVSGIRTSERLLPGQELRLGQVVYIPLEGRATMEVGQVPVQNAKYLWIAHSPQVLAMTNTEGGMNYGLQTVEGVTVLVPEAAPGQAMTLFGRVDTPERNLLKGVRAVMAEHRQEIRPREPYFVTVGTPDGKLEYRNVPQVEIRF